ncbi:MAG: universal stress protein [Thermoanaerobaculia bacterium]
MTDRTPIRTVLVATDFSDTAQAGIDWALELARTHQAQIVLVHGVMLPNRATDFVPSPPDLTEKLQEAASGRLNDAAERARGRGVEVITDLRIGLPSQAILEAAEERNVDLVVLGTRGLTGLQHLFLGSTAQRVVQHANCPVLTVHPGDIDQHRQIRTVLVPTDFSRDAELSTTIALDLLAKQSRETTLVLLHVYHLPYEYTAYGTIPTSLDYFKDVEGAAEDRLRKLAEPLASEGLSVKTVAREGYPPEIIVGEAEACGADLIALGTHGRSGLTHLLLGSTAERVVQHASCPVLTVRRQED